MNAFITKLQNQPKKHYVLSIFRILLAFHLLKDLIFNWTSLELLYSNNTYLVQPVTGHISKETLVFFTNNYQYFITIYSLLIVMFLFGIGKNITVLFLYLFIDLIQRIGGGYTLNGGDNWLKFLILYMIFCNSFEYFTLNKKKWFSNRWFSNVLTNIFSFSILFHFCIIYFFSAFYKINSDVWVNGVANYYILNISRFKSSSLNDIITSNGYLVAISTYLVLLWEIAFPFLIWKNKLVRNILLMIGVFIHLGIYFMMNIHDFEILFIFTYIIFFDDIEIKEFVSKVIKIKNKLLKNNIVPKSNFRN
jgi:hypothetical protein